MDIFVIPALAGFSIHITVAEYSLCNWRWKSRWTWHHADPKSETSGDSHEFYAAGTAVGDVSHRFKTGGEMKWSWDVSWIRAGPGPLESASRLNHENSKLGFAIPGGSQRISDHV